MSPICVSKTRRLIGLLYGHFYKFASSSTLLKLYINFILPRLEYSSAVWNPHLKGEIDALEWVQKYALIQKVCTKSWDASYEKLSITSIVTTKKSTDIPLSSF